MKPTFTNDDMIAFAELCKANPDSSTLNCLEQYVSSKPKPVKRKKKFYVIDDIFDYAGSDFVPAGDDINSDLAEYLSDCLRDIFDFNAFDEPDEYAKYFVWNEDVYEIAIEEDGCVESTWDGRIMNWKSTVTVLSSLEDLGSNLGPNYQVVFKHMN